MANAIAFEALTQIWRKAGDVAGWFVGRYMLMPDHVHFFARPALEARSLAAWMEGWKSFSARRISAGLRISPPIWQQDYFDRFLRFADDYSQKWDYVEMNPVRKGLCRQPADWPWQGQIFDLKF